MKIALYSLLVISLIACSKYTTPKKVTKKLTVGTWLLNEFFEDEKSIIKKYKDVSFTFSEEGTVATTSESKVSGTWELGSDKDPAIMYLNFPETDSMHVLSDDWIVFKINKEECILKRKVDEENFSYESSFDRVRLLKKK
jgi:hypothetical protein